MKSFLIFAFLGLTASTAWADTTVKNISDRPVRFNVDGPAEILPGESMKLPFGADSSPQVERLIQAGRLVVLESKLTFEDCEKDDRDGYCYMDVAVQDKSTVGCAYYEMWSAAKECLYYVDRERKLTEKDCLVFNPGSSVRKECQDYVASGIPSKPGQSYEQSQKL
jgi:hypothetical protein